MYLHIENILEIRSTIDVCGETSLRYLNNVYMYKEKTKYIKREFDDLKSFYVRAQREIEFKEVFISNLLNSKRRL